MFLSSNPYPLTETINLGFQDYSSEAGQAISDKAFGFGLNGRQYLNHDTRLELVQAHIISTPTVVVVGGGAWEAMSILTTSLLPLL